MSVKSFTHYVDTQEASPLLGSTPFEIQLTIPADLESRKVPISVHVFFEKRVPPPTGSEKEASTAAAVDNSDVAASQQQASTLVYYHYAVPSHLRHRKAGEDIAGISLLDTSDDTVRDISRKLCEALARKYQKPCYVAWSSARPGGSAQSSIDQLYVLKNCMDFVNGVLDKARQEQVSKLN